MRKQVVEKLIAESEYMDFPAFWNKGFNLLTLADKAQYHGLIGAKNWDKNSLRMVIDRFRAHTQGEDYREEKIDAMLEYFALKADLDLNLLRRLFYEPLEQPEEAEEEKTEEAEAEEGEEEEEGEAD